LIYLAHAFLEVRGEAAGDDRATAVHTLDDIGGDDGVRLAEHVDPALAPALLGGPASTGVVVVVASGGGGRRRTCRPDAELLLLGVDAAVQAEARDAVALRRDVRHGAVEELLEATERQLPAPGGLPVRSRIERNWERDREREEGRRTWDLGLRGASLDDDMPPFVSCFRPVSDVRSTTPCSAADAQGTLIQGTFA